MKRKLTFQQCNDYKEIPIELIDQIEGDEWIIDNYIAYQEAMKNNPNYFLFKLLDLKKNREIIGFLCGVVDEVKKSLFIRGISVKREYQDGNIIPFTKRFIEMVIRKSKGYLKNIYWTTDRPNAYKKYGFYESKYKIMTLYQEK